MGSPCPVCHCLPGTLPLHKLLAGELISLPIKSHLQQDKAVEVIDWECWESQAVRCLFHAAALFPRLGAAVCWSA